MRYALFIATDGGRSRCFAVFFCGGIFFCTNAQFFNQHPAPEHLHCSKMIIIFAVAHSFKWFRHIFSFKPKNNFIPGFIFINLCLLFLGTVNDDGCSNFFPFGFCSFSLIYLSGWDLYDAPLNVLQTEMIPKHLKVPKLFRGKEAKPTDKEKKIPANNNNYILSAN